QMEDRCMMDAEIKQALQKVVEATVMLLNPLDRPKALQKIYVAGGAIVNLVLDTAPEDYDLFVEDQETADLFKAVCSLASPPENAELLANTQNGVTFKLRTGEVVQVITRFVGPPSRVFESFDYVHCKCFFIPETANHPSHLVMQRGLIE